MATQHRIELIEGKHPIRQELFRAWQSSLEGLSKHINKQLEAGVVERAQSEWSSLIVMGPTKDGTFWLCVDFRHLNDSTIPYIYLLPRMDDCIDSIEEAEEFTCLDAL